MRIPVDCCFTESAAGQFSQQPWAATAKITVVIG